MAVEEGFSLLDDSSPDENALPMDGDAMTPEQRLNAPVCAEGGISCRRADHEAHVAARRAALQGRVAETLLALALHRETVLEVGCGHGHFLAAYAQAHPDRGCIGIDYANERVTRANRKQTRAGLQNLRFLRAEAMEFLAALPSTAQLSRVFVLFPDPWPKKRHHKNRLMCGDFLGRLVAHVTSDADLFFRTDSQGYFDEVLALVGEHAEWRVASDQSWEFEHPTVFQQKVGSFCSVRLVRTVSAR